MLHCLVSWRHLEAFASIFVEQRLVGLEHSLSRYLFFFFFFLTSLYIVPEGTTLPTLSGVAVKFMESLFDSAQTLFVIRLVRHARNHDSFDQPRRGRVA